jgi:hypothetical protein
MAWGIVWGFENPRAALTSRQEKRSIQILRIAPMNDTRILRIQVADEYRVITRAKLGNHPNRNFEI